MKKITLAEKLARQEKRYSTAFQRKGNPIKSVEELIVLALNCKAVFCENSWGLLPAEAVLNMPTWCVAGAINQGRIYEYPSRGLPLLFMHKHDSPIGIARDVRLEGNTLDALFSLEKKARINVYNDWE